MKIALFVVVLFCVSFMSVNAQWMKQDVKTDASFRGLSVVNEKVVWASGTGGTVVRTTDGGSNWDVIKVQNAEKLDFRDIEAFDANTAYILSIGNGEASRIYKTTDGGKTWKEQFRNTNEKAFFDAIACWNKTNCIAMSDPVDGHYVLISTKNGETWQPIVSNKLPAAKDGEAAFAASGTCLITLGDSTAYLVTGGSEARVFRSYDKGQTWAVADTPITKGTAGSGIFSIAMRDGKRGIIVGGNYEKPSDKTNAAAFTHDGGRTWQPVTGMNGYRSGVVFLDNKTIVAVGTSGSEVSFDRGKTWRSLGSENLNAVAADKKMMAWAVGPKGFVGRIFLDTITLD